MKYKNEDSEIVSIETVNTGGNVINDIIVLKDDSICVITSDAIYYFCNREDYDNCDESKFISRFE